jgi:hypothetical protein
VLEIAASDIDSKVKCDWSVQFKVSCPIHSTFWHK